MAGLRRLRILFEEVWRAESRDPALANTGLAYLQTVAWRAFLDSAEVVDSVDVHPAVRAAARLRQAEPNTEADLASLARRAGLSPTHLSRLFAAQIGVSLTRYRNQHRLHRFLSGHGDGTRTTALAAALAAGFGSYAQFYRVFRQETGRTPATLREPLPVPASMVRLTVPSRSCDFPAALGSTDRPAAPAGPSGKPDEPDRPVRHPAAVLLAHLVPAHGDLQGLRLGPPGGDEVDVDGPCTPSLGPLKCVAGGPPGLLW